MTPEDSDHDPRSVTTWAEEFRFALGIGLAALAVVLLPGPVRLAVLAAGLATIAGGLTWWIWRWRTQNRAVEADLADRDATEHQRGAAFADDVETWLHQRT